MLRKAVSIVVHSLCDGDISALSIKGGPCAEHENGMAYFVSNLGMEPSGYGFAFPSKNKVKAKAVRSSVSFGGVSADVLALGNTDVVAGDLRKVSDYVEEDWPAIVRNTPDLACVHDAAAMVFAATSPRGVAVLGWLEGILREGWLGVRFARRSVVLVDVTTLGHGALTWFTEEESLSRRVVATFRTDDRDTRGQSPLLASEVA